MLSLYIIGYNPIAVEIVTRGGCAYNNLIDLSPQCQRIALCYNLRFRLFCWVKILCAVR